MKQIKTQGRSPFTISLVLAKWGIRAQQYFEGLLDHIAGVVVTSRQNIRLALLGLFAQGHILLEDLPGVGKTLLAKTIATSVEGEFSRIQFTPDLLPSDITGTSVFDMGKQAFQFIPGPIFANVVVADELNRTGPRTQSALLEAMAEGMVSADGTVWPLPRPSSLSPPRTWWKPTALSHCPSPSLTGSCCP